MNSTRSKNMKFLTKFIYLVILTVFTFSLAGCNTMAGFGQDLQAGGKALTKAADKDKPHHTNNTNNGNNNSSAPR